MRARQETVLLLFQSARFSQHVHDQYTFSDAPASLALMIVTD